MKNIIYIFTLAALLVSSCDVLDMKPLDKMIDSDVWSDQAMIQLYVNTTYRALPSGFQGDILSSACDESYGHHNSGSYRTVLKGELSPDNVSSLGWKLNYWETAYKRIRDINIFFSKIENAPVDDNFKASSKAEMSFIRAFIYANLVARYGGVPIIKKIYELNEDYAMSRNLYDECVQYILDELDAAMKVLPNKQPDDQLGRASSDACRALKVRVLLYAASPLANTSGDKAKWQAAANAAKDLIDDTRYALQDDYQSVFLADNNEIIFSRSYTQANQSWFHRDNGRNGSGGWGAENPSQQLINAFEMTNGELPYLADGTVNPASGYDPQKPYINRDPRFSASILYDGLVWQGRETQTYVGGADSPQGAYQGWNSSESGYYYKKFQQESIPPEGSSVTPTSPWIFFRYGEILLNYAEAMFELGEEATAREYLNKIRDRASVKMPAIPATVTGEALRIAIQQERRIELVFEEHRFFDVRRWKIAMQTENVDMTGVNITKNADGSKSYAYTRAVTERSFEEQHYWMPVPRAEVEKSLGSLAQSPLYK